MPDTKTEAERRMHAAWQARACAASISVGAQVFLFGAGVVMPLCLNSAWLAAVSALPAAGLLCAFCVRASVRRRICSRVRAGLLCAFFLLSAAFAAASLINLAEQSLLPQERSLWIAAATALFLFAASLSGSTGASRLCFALRFVLPGALALLSALSLPAGTFSGLFPLMGAGLLPLLASAACMCGAAAPAAMILLPPREIGQHGDADTAMPGASFFVRRVLAGAGMGVLLLFLLCACGTYASMEESGTWGARLIIASSARPHEGPAHALLIVCQIIAVCLLALSMLTAAVDALHIAFPRSGGGKIAVLMLCAGLFFLLFACISFGFSCALLAAPLIALPALAAIVPLPRGKGNRKGGCAP